MSRQNQTLTTGETTLERLFLGYLNSRFENGIKSPLDEVILSHPSCQELIKQLYSLPTAWRESEFRGATAGRVWIRSAGPP